MLKIINTIIDVVFPPRAHERLVRTLSPQDMAYLYIPGTSNGVVFLSRYKNPTVRALIKENKYHHNAQAANHLAALLHQWLLTRPENTLLLIPVPLGSRRRRQRGHNQVLSIIKSLPQSNTYSYSEQLLSRQKETVTQTKLRKSQRQHNLKGAFIINTHQLNLEKLPATIILIDDVVTTGATLHAARLALSQHLPPTTTIISLALAH